MVQSGATNGTKLLRYPSVPGTKLQIAACLGNFDGVHLGHQALLSKIREYKKSHPDSRTMLLSFYPHPAVVLGKASELPVLTGPSQMLKILSGLEIDFLYLVHFTKAFSKISAEKFIAEILLKKLNISYMAVGEDARVGAAAEGDSAFILKSFEAAGKKADVLKFVDVDNTRISSRTVRESIAQGRVLSAARMLGRPFAVTGRVVRGKQLGRTMGFPTANIKVKNKQIIPSLGVYAGRVLLENKLYSAVCNIGFRPTVGGDSMSIECYLLDYTGDDFYGQKIEFQFVDKLRDEKKFENMTQLKQQISSDVEDARKVLK